MYESDRIQRERRDQEQRDREEYQRNWSREQDRQQDEREARANRDNWASIHRQSAENQSWRDRRREEVAREEGIGGVHNRRDHTARDTAGVIDYRRTTLTLQQQAEERRAAIAAQRRTAVGLPSTATDAELATAERAAVGLLPTATSAELAAAQTGAAKVRKADKERKECRNACCYAMVGLSFLPMVWLATWNNLQCCACMDAIHDLNQNDGKLTHTLGHLW
jgi:hypothetical protein